MTSREVQCANCGAILGEATDLPPSERPPCATCGSINRVVHLTARSVIRVFGTVNITADDQVASSQGTVQPGPIEIKVSLPTPTIEVSEPTREVADLPTEVVADSLQIRMNLLRPNDGNWMVDAEAFGELGHSAVGMLDDALLAAMEWISGLAVRWEELNAEKDRA